MWFFRVKCGNSKSRDRNVPTIAVEGIELIVEPTDSRDIPDTVSEFVIVILSEAKNLS